MFDGILSMDLTSGVFPIAVYTLGLVALVVLALSHRSRRWFMTLAIVGGGGFGLGLFIAWLVGDVFDLFGLALTIAIRLWFSLAIAGIAIAVAAWIRGRRSRIAIPLVSILIFALVGATGINADVGEYPDLTSLLGIQDVSKHALPVAVPSPLATAQSDSAILATWQPPADLPKTGRLNSVSIPGTLSRFAARHAIVYLPPAALVPNPPRLPLLMMMSGQPGSPAQTLASSGLEATLNSFAAHHRGLAPILIIPDQLGQPFRNPMCVDSALGDSATYLTVDVPNWIRSHLNVIDDPSEWAVAGFSQGGTCAIQFGAGYPKLFGSLVDISGELKPHTGSSAQTIAAAFGGSAQAYTNAWPTSVLAANTPYENSLAIFGVGANDSKFNPMAHVLAAAASHAGMYVDLFVSPGTAHDWHTVRYTIDHALPILARKFGFDG